MKMTFTINCSISDVHVFYDYLEANEQPQLSLLHYAKTVIIKYKTKTRNRWEKNEIWRSSQSPWIQSGGMGSLPAGASIPNSLDATVPFLPSLPLSL